MDRTMPAAHIETLTSGASGRIIPVFHRAVIYLRSFLRVLLFFRSIFLWFILLPHRGGRRNTLPSPPSSPHPSARRRPGGRFRRAAEEDDARRRRTLAEGLEVDGAENFFIEGRRRNALFCRSWGPLAGDLKGILVIIHGLNEHSPIDSDWTVVGVRLFSREINHLLSGSSALNEL